MAENAVNAVTKTVTPIVAPPPEEGEARDKNVIAVETAAGEALKKIEAAKTMMNEQIKLVQGYVPEARKTSNASMAELQKKLAECLKTVNVYESFKVQLPKLAENQKIITGVSDKLAGHEAALTKAGDLAKAATMTNKKVEKIDRHLAPMTETLKESNIAMGKLRAANSVTQDKVTKLRTRQAELKTKIDVVISKIKGPRDIINPRRPWTLQRICC